MAPASFCAMSGVARIVKTAARRRAEKIRRRGTEIGMARLLKVSPNVSQNAGRQACCRKIRMVELCCFRCNITNYYFYFRLVAFVNSVIWFRASEKVALSEQNRGW